MIILNISGLLYLVIVSLSAFLASGLLPGGNSDFADLVFLFYCLIVGIGMRLLGFKPRLFFLPVWVLACIGIFIKGFDLYGWYALAAFAGFCLVIYWRLKLTGQKNSRLSIEQGFSAFTTYETNSGEMSDREKRALLANSFIANPYSTEHRNVVEHNIKVLTLIKEKYRLLFSGEHLERLQVMIKVFSENLSRNCFKLKNFQEPEELKKIIQTTLS